MEYKMLNTWLDSSFCEKLSSVESHQVAFHILGHATQNMCITIANHETSMKKKDYFERCYGKRKSYSRSAYKGLSKGLSELEQIGILEDYNIDVHGGDVTVWFTQDFMDKVFYVISPIVFDMAIEDLTIKVNQIISEEE